MLPNPVELVKQAALEAVDASGPVQIVFGKVISTSPLKIQSEQKAIYTEKMLILTRNVTDYEVDVSVSAQSVVISHGHDVVDTYTGGGSATPMNHNHPINGKKKVKVHNALLVDDEVILLRVQGGKKYVVLDRIKPIPELKGEWL